MEVFVGIDVACAKSKRLPICVARKEGNKLIPLEFRAELPRGPGNIEITKSQPFRGLAKSIAFGFEEVCREKGWHVKRVAIDAPASAPAAGQQRLCEDEMSKRKISFFQTPDVARWDEIKEGCHQHLKLGGLLSKLPHANKIWMLYGFELFSSLRSVGKIQVVEVYPYAIVSELLPGCAHKSTKEGYGNQLSEIASRTGWSSKDLEEQLKVTTFGGKHDKLDAFMAAWVASLPKTKLKAYGNPKNADNSIWIPDRELLLQ